MRKKSIATIKKDARDIYYASLKSVDPKDSIIANAFLRNHNLLIQGHKFDLSKFNRIFVLGAGKAAASMAAAIEEIIGERIHRGLTCVKYGYTALLKKIEIIEAGHPVPDLNGLRASKEMMKILEGIDKKDLVIFLISGGCSSLLPSPPEGITLEEKKHLTRLLLECGASIDEINAIRKHVSFTKGGRLASLAYPAPVLNLILSDVVGDDLSVIGSGPFSPDESTYEQCLKILGKYDLTDKLPPSIISHFRKGYKGAIPETPKPGDRIFRNITNLVVGSNIRALKTAKKRARELGYRCIILSSMVKGEAKDVAKVLAGIGKEVLSTDQPVKMPCCILSGGETTVTISGKGKGGRNQELALAFALEIKGTRGIVFLSAGTDGTDGPTDAAGGIVDGNTIGKGLSKKLDPIKYLTNNDSYHFLNKTDDLFFTGPTNTNVMDIQILLVNPVMN